MSTNPLHSASAAELIPVRDLGDLDYLVKEGEMLTGIPGRDFVVLGADRPAFRVKVDLSGYEIQRLDAPPDSSPLLLASAEDLLAHALGDALRCGLLFTAALQ